MRFDRGALNHTPVAAHTCAAYIGSCMRLVETYACPHCANMAAVRRQQ